MTTGTVRRQRLRPLERVVARPQPKPAAAPGGGVSPSRNVSVLSGAPGLAGAEAPLSSADAANQASPGAEAEAEAPPPAAPLVPSASSTSAASLSSAPSVPAALPPAPGRLDPAGPDTYNVRFGAERGLIEKLERFGAVAGFRNPVRDIARIIERALDVALEAKDPERREARRRRRAEERAARAACEEAARANEEAAGEAAPEEPPPPSAVGPGPDKTRPDEAVEVEEHKPNTHTPEPARSR